MPEHLVDVAAGREAVATVLAQAVEDFGGDGPPLPLPHLGLLFLALAPPTPTRSRHFLFLSLSPRFFFCSLLSLEAQSTTKAKGVSLNQSSVE